MICSLVYAWLTFFILVLLAYDNAFSVHAPIYIHVSVYISYTVYHIYTNKCIYVYVHIYLYILNTYHCVPWKNGIIVERRGRDASELHRAIVNRKWRCLDAGSQIFLYVRSKFEVRRDSSSKFASFFANRPFEIYYIILARS